MKQRSRHDTKRVLAASARKARARTAARGATRPAEQRVGVLSVTQKGFGFVACAEEQRDLFVPAGRKNGAMHGDTVRVRRAEADTDGRGGAWEVTAVLAHAVRTFVGTVRLLRGFASVEPDDKRLDPDIALDKGALAGAQNGQKVVAEIVRYGTRTLAPVARVVEVLGDPDGKGVDVLSVIRAHGLYEEFPRAVVEEAHAAPAAVPDEALGGRRDFRSTLVITIDGEDAKDLDDAISVERTEDGWALAVHIADVAHYVRAGSALDAEAFKRGTSVYFPDRVLPMLPRELSNGICSLNEGADRLTLSCLMRFDAAGERLSAEIVKGVIRSRRRMTYTAVQGILDGDPALCETYADLIPMLGAARELEAALRARREARGAIDFPLPETHVVLDAQSGRIAGVAPYPRLTAHRIIEAFMLAANEAVAERFCRARLPFVYRVHEPPTAEKLEAFAAFVAPFGLSLGKTDEGIAPAQMQALLAQAHGAPFERVVSEVGLRSMQKARYSAVCSGHFALAAPYYCHFTSPIRRYPDLTVHRIIGAFLSGGRTAAEPFRAQVAEIAEQSSVRERLAEEAEREVDELKKAEYMADHIGETFHGSVSGATPFGLFVTLDNTCEGLIRIETLPDDAYTCNEARFELRGATHVFRLGDPVDVVVVGASKEDRRVDFELAETAPAVEKFVPEIKRMVMPGDGSDRFGAIGKSPRAPRQPRPQNGKKGKRGSKK